MKIWGFGWLILVFAAGCSDANGSDSNSGGSNSGGSNSTAGANSNKGGTAGSSSPGGAGGNTGNAAMACQANPPCGGDIVGTWNISESCIGVLSGVQTCPTLTADGSQLEQRGTVTYGSDGSYTSTSTTAGTLRITYPSTCTASLSCSELEQALSASLPAGYQSVACQDAAAGACLCSFVLATPVTTDSGTYATANGVLTQTSSLGSSSSDYCVMGKQLKLTLHDSSSGQISETFTLELE